MSDDVPQDGKQPTAAGGGDEAEEIVDVGADQGDDEAPEPDDGGEADLGDDEGQDDEGQARPQNVAEPPRTRGAQRFERLSNENRDLRNRVADFERQLAQLTQQQRQPSQAELAEAERREAEAVSMMAPAEVAKYYTQKSEQRIATELNQTRQMLWDQNDAAQFEQLQTQNPTYRRYADRVEELRRQAPGVSRKILLATAIGMRAMEGAPAARTRGQNRAAATAERNQARAPSNGRGDVAAPQERGGSGNRWERLRNVQI